MTTTRRNRDDGLWVSNFGFFPGFIPLRIFFSFLFLACNHDLACDVVVVYRFLNVDVFFLIFYVVYSLDGFWCVWSVVPYIFFELLMYVWMYIMV